MGGPAPGTLPAEGRAAAPVQVDTCLPAVATGGLPLSLLHASLLLDYFARHFIVVHNALLS